jgi:hypothetical protein
MDIRRESGGVMFVLRGIWNLFFLTIYLLGFLIAAIIASKSFAIDNLLDACFYSSLSVLNLFFLADLKRDWGKGRF